uniref:Uncharacterized protein n=1 Tax=Alexandrium catenella TaxID=2925 RepID=A0A7S1SEY6_ALECA
MDFEAGSRENWHIGSAVEVFSSSDRRWHIGWVVKEELGGSLRIFLDDHSVELIRRDDTKLAALGTSINRLPPQSEVVSAGRTQSVILHQPSGRQCLSLEEAWSAHFDVFHRCHVQQPHQVHGNISARGDPESNGFQVVGARSGSPLLADRPRPNDLSISVVHESELDWLRAENSRLAGWAEETDAMARSLKAENKELIAEVQELKAELKQARGDLDRYVGGVPSPGLSRSLPSVPRSWQPHRQDAGAEAHPDTGQRGSAQPSSSSRPRCTSTDRSGERPVEVCVSVPRAMTPDELLEEAVREERRTVPPVRSVRSLAQAVVRMPSAPHPLTSHSGGLAVSVAASPHSVCIMPGSSQAPQPVPTLHSAPAAPPANQATRLVTAQSARASSTWSSTSPTASAGVHKVFSYRR